MRYIISFSLMLFSMGCNIVNFSDGINSENEKESQF